MKLTLFILLLAFNIFTVQADEWASEGVNRLDDDSEWLKLQTQQGQLFFVRDNDLSLEQIKQTIALVKLFYGWHSIQLYRLEFVVDTDHIQALVLPSRAVFDQQELTEHLQGGLRFIFKDNTISYNFRLLDQQLFIKLNGKYEGEEALLFTIKQAIEHPNEHLNIYEPKYMYAQLSELQAEVNNLRKTIVELNKKQFCHFNNCHRKSEVDDKLYSASRYSSTQEQAAKNALRDLGYSLSEGDEWGYLAFKALLRFQQKSPLLEVNGELDRITQIALANPDVAKLKINKLNLLQALPKLNLTPTQRRLLNQKIQMALANWSKQPSRFDGKWQQQDEYQLIYFQDAHKLEVSGVWDQATLNQLFTMPVQNIIENLELAAPENTDVAQTNTALYVQGFEAPFNSEQWQLSSSAAIAQFQQAMELTITGQPDKDTLFVLFAGEPSNFVLKIQRLLQAKGYEFGELDGVWGDRTSGAVTLFQRDSGLEETGWFDGATREQMEL